MYGVFVCKHTGGGRERCLLLKHTSSCSAHHFVCCYASLVFVAMHHLCLLLCITCVCCYASLVFVAMHHLYVKYLVGLVVNMRSCNHIYGHVMSYEKLNESCDLRHRLSLLECSCSLK